MALEGNLQDFGLEAIFQLINSEKKTGTLHIVRRAGDAEGFVYFRGGRIYGAVSNFNRQPIGERLINAGYIVEEQLHHALEVQRNGKKRRKLGQILISEGLITEEILRTFVKEQIQNTVFDLLPWTDGEFRFFENKLPASEDMGLLLSAKKILSKSSERLDEWDRIRELVPSGRAVFDQTENAGEKAQAAGFTPLHWKVVDLIDGNRSVMDIVRELEVSEFEISSHLSDLAEAGLISLVREDDEFAEEGDFELSPGGEKVDGFDVMEELELSPEDIIGDRGYYMSELVALTDSSRGGHKRRIFMPAASAAVLAERVHLDREATPELLALLIEKIKGIK